MTQATFDNMGEHGNEGGSVAALLPLVYEELRLLARRHRGKPSGPQAAGTTSLVHEAYLKLTRQRQLAIKNRAQFFFLAAKVMRSIIIDNARHAMRIKRGGGEACSDLDPELVSSMRSEELLQLDDALEALQRHDQRGYDIVVCRFFGGLEIDETALAIGCSDATVKRHWTLARSWLFREMGGSGLPP
ncbi:MAG: ECF-type sigma factor [Pseudomarimonas sp.]